MNDKNNPGDKMEPEEGWQEYQRELRETGYRPPRSLPSKPTPGHRARNNWQRVRSNPKLR